MANHKIDPEILAHLEWIGFVRPTGLVVSAPALVRAGAILDRRDAEGQRLLRECVAERVFEPKDGPVPYLPSFRQFADSVLGWKFLAEGLRRHARIPNVSRTRSFSDGLRRDSPARLRRPGA